MRHDQFTTHSPICDVTHFVLSGVAYFPMFDMTDSQEIIYSQWIIFILNRLFVCLVYMCDMTHSPMCDMCDMRHDSFTMYESCHARNV